MLERHFQASLIKKLRLMFVGCIILKNDSGYLQGVPDLIILFRDRWAMLEIKMDAKAPFRPNQEFYLDLLNAMSFASVIYPEIEEEVLRDLQQAFQVGGATRLSKP